LNDQFDLVQAHRKAALRLAVELASRNGDILSVKALLSALSWQKDSGSRCLLPALKKALKGGHAENAKAIVASVPAHISKTQLNQGLYIALKRKLWALALNYWI